MTFKKPRNILLLLAILLACAIAAVVVWRYRPAVEVADIARRLPEGVNVALQDINYTHTEGGVARWRLVARQVEHRAVQKQISVEELRLTFFDGRGEEQGVLAASRGQVDSDFTVVEVEGSVVIENRSGFRLKTDRLTFRQTDREIRTDAPVEVDAPDARLEGVGLILNVDTQNLRILKRVRAVLKPNAAFRESS